MGKRGFGRQGNAGLRGRWLRRQRERERAEKGSRPETDKAGGGQAPPAGEEAAEGGGRQKCG